MGSILVRSSLLCRAVEPRASCYCRTQHSLVLFVTNLLPFPLPPKTLDEQIERYSFDILSKSNETLGEAPRILNAVVLQRVVLVLFPIARKLVFSFDQFYRELASIRPAVASKLDQDR